MDEVIEDQVPTKVDAPIPRSSEISIEKALIEVNN